MNDDLKPCPFCGGFAAMHQAHDPDGPNDQAYYIECGKCGASTNLRFSCGEDARPLLVEQWNQRSDRLEREMSSVLRDLAEACAEVSDLTPQAYRDRVLRLGARARVLMTPNAANQRTTTAPLT